MEFGEEYGIIVGDVLCRATSTVPPWSRSPPRINKSLAEYDKNITPSPIYQLLFAEQIATYEDYLKIFTDGSKTRAGVGAAIVVGDSEYSWCLEHFSNIYTAESFAIWQALLFFQSSGQDKCLIITDSLSVLTAMEHLVTIE